MTDPEQRTGPQDEDQDAAEAPKVEVLMPGEEPRERSDLAHAGDVDLSLGGMPGWAERGRLWAHERLAQAQKKVLDAKRELHESATAFLRSQETLQQEIERNREWKANIDKVRARISAEFDEEEHQRTIRKLERDLELAQAELAAAEAAAELEDRKIALEQQKRRREEAGNKQPRTSSQQSAEDVFRAQAEQILQHGATGRFIPIAEEMRQKLIDERGGEENLTDADREHIELMFEHARRKEESKS